MKQKQRETFEEDNIQVGHPGTPKKLQKLKAQNKKQPSTVGQ